MSLMDTIKGAREEATANFTPREGGKAEDKTADADSSVQGFTRRSAARGRPAREASAGVRKVAANGKAKSKAKLTKEERKAEQRHEREVDDQRYNVAQMILDSNADYKHYRTVWKRILIAGFGFMIVAVVLYGVVARGGVEANEIMAAVTIACMVVSYGFIIASLIYDWRKVRPLRQGADKRVASMSEKRLVSALNRGNIK